MNKIWVSLHRGASIVWLAMVLLLAGYSYHALVSNQRIQLDILAMLPASHSEMITEVKALLDDTKITQHNLVLFGHKDAAISKEALHHFRQHLAIHNLPIEENSVKNITERYHNLFKSLFAHRSGLLSQEDHNHLSAKNHDHIVQTALSEIVSLFAPVNLREDPFSFFSHFVKSNQMNSPFLMDGESDLYITSGDITWYVYSGILQESAFSMDIQEKVSEVVLPFLEKQKQQDGLHILKTGGIFYATAGAEQARQEISLIGLISTIGIILMMLIIFHSLRPLAFAMCVITTAIVTGFAACLLAFGSVHILAIVIGCTLVGITVDYALHYTCASYIPFKENTSRFTVLQKLMPALPLSVLSSAAGYALLLFIPFPGIQQMALLSSVGLLTSFISVCLWGPYIIKTHGKDIPAMSRRIQDLLENCALFGIRKNFRLRLAFCLTSIFLGGILHLTSEDNVRSFQALNQELKDEEDQIKSMIDLDAASTFLLVKGKTWEEVLQRQEAMMPDLDKLGIPYRCVATLIPSQKRQAENRQWLREFYPIYLPNLLSKLGQKASMNLNQLGLDTSLLAMDPHLLPMGWQELVHIHESGDVVGRIMITKVADETYLRQIAQSHPHVWYINAQQEYSHLFATYRHGVSGLIFLVLGGIFILLGLRTGFKSAVHVVTPVILSLMGTVGLLGLFMPFNLFHVMGLLLVLCIGIDYALFLFWRNPGWTKELSLLGNGLAAVTTILSFGLLAFSKTKAVYSFGLSVFLGISLCFIVTTIFLGARSSSHEL